MKNIFLKKFNILLILVFSVSALYGQASLKLNLAQEQKNLNTALVTVSISNENNETIKVLRWNTAFEKTLNSNIFHVMYGSHSTEYIGRVVKRLQPTESDYMTLQADETKTVTVDLSKYYRLETEGKYVVSYIGILKAKGNIEQIVADGLSKNTVPSVVFSYVPLATQKKRFQIVV